MRVTPGEVLVFILVVLGVLLIGSLFLMFFWGMGSMGWGMMGPGMMGPGTIGGMGTWWWLMSCLIPIGLVLLIVLGVAGLLGLTQRAPESSSAKQTCPNCGQDVQAGWQLCPYCGTALQERDV